MNTPTLLPSRWDAKQAGDRVLAQLVNVCLPTVKGAHDADLLIVDGKAYVVYMANDVQPGENAAWPFVYNALSVVDVASRRAEHTVTFAASGKAYANETLPVGACFVPRLLRNDGRTLRSIHRARIETGAGVSPMQPRHLYRAAVARGLTRPERDCGLYLIDGFKEFDGRRCAVVNNFSIAQNAWAVLNEACDQFTVLGHYFEPTAAALSESAVNRLPDGTWCAISRQEGGDHNYLFTRSPDGVHWTPHEASAFVPNGTNSKPTFDRFGGVYYLGWQEATRVRGVFRSVFNLDVSRDGRRWERKYRFETDRSFQYPTFREYQGAIYLTVTQGDSSDQRKERIMFGRLE
jgi:hypothetical protein